MSTLQDVKSKLRWARDNDSWVSLTPEDCGVLLEQIPEDVSRIHPEQLAITGSISSGPYRQPDTLRPEPIDLGGYPV